MIKEDEKDKRKKYHEAFIKKMSKVDNNQIPINPDYCDKQGEMTREEKEFKKREDERKKRDDHITNANYEQKFNKYMFCIKRIYNN